VLHESTIAQGPGRAHTWRGLASAVSLAALLGCGAAHGPQGAPLRLEPQVASLACPEWAELGFGAPSYWSSRAAPLVLAPTCVAKPAHGCAYTFELPDRERVKLSLMTADFDGALALFGDAGDHSGELACTGDSPDGRAREARLERVLGKGRYVAYVTSPHGDAGRFALFAEREPVPSELAVCRAAQPLAKGELRRGTTEGRASHFSSACAGGDGPDAAFRFTLGEPSRVRLRQQTTHDGILSLRALGASSCDELSCSDDFIDGEHAQLTRRLPAGEYVAVTDGYGSVTGGGTYVLSFAAVPEPPSMTRAALCGAAAVLPLDGRPLLLDTLRAPSVLRGSCNEGDAPELLFRFSLPARSLVTFTLESPELHAALYLLGSCEDPGSELACALGPRTDRAFSGDATQRGSHDVLVEDLAAGDYVLVVDGATAHAMGSATLRASVLSGALPAL
jgi:hypothetical protein